MNSRFSRAVYGYGAQWPCRISVRTLVLMRNDFGSVVVENAAMSWEFEQSAASASAIEVPFKYTATSGSHFWYEFAQSGRDGPGRSKLFHGWRHMAEAICYHKSCMNH